MTDLTKKLLKLMSEGKTINEISEITGLSNRQLFNIITMIRTKGFEFDRKYYYNGDIVYVPETSLLDTKTNGTNIITSPKDNDFEALVISDLHIGSRKDSFEILDRLYNYCVKEGIHIIIICGDFIDGTFGRTSKYFHDIDKQIDYAIRNYPFDKSILNFTVFGDHDYDGITSGGQNLSKVFENYRHDIVSLGFNCGQINIKNDRIIVCHPINGFNIKENYQNCLLLEGHYHRMAVTNKPSRTVVTIPSVSHMQFNEDDMMPAAVRMKLSFSKGLITSGIFNQLLIGEKIYKINEMEYLLNTGKNFCLDEPIKLEEERVKKKVLVPEKIESKSQIEKFNERFGIK